MAQVKILSLDLIPFKGIEKEITFKGNNTVIQGDNGTGKTTIADAWIWLLTGKSFAGLTDSGKAAFNPIPYGEKVAEVTAGIKIENDGEEFLFTLTRKIEEKNKSKKTFYYIQDTECQKKDFDEFVSTKICNGFDFRTLSIPEDFLKRDWKIQREALLRETKNITLADVAYNDPDKLAVAKEIEISVGGFDVWEKSIKKNIKTLQEELKAVPEKIAAVNALRPEPRDYAAIEKEIKKLSEQTTDTNPELKKLQEEKNKIQIDGSLQRGKAFSELNAAKEALSALQSEQRIAKNKFDSRIAELKENSERLTRDLKILNSDIVKLRERYTQIAAKNYLPADGQIVCPLAESIICENPILLANRREAEKQAAAKYEENKLAELNRINKEGQEMAAKIKEKTNLLQICENELKAPYSDPYIEKIAAAQKEVESKTALIPPEPDTTELDKKIAELSKTNSDENRIKKLSELSAQLAEREVVAKIEKQIADINSDTEKKQAQLGVSEMKLALGQDLRQSQMKELESLVNSQFDNGLEFKLFEEQVNGEFAPTCKVLVDSIPYGQGLNRAMEVNAGIQIVDYFQRCTKVFLPVFVDNAESVNYLYKTESQVIALKVTEDDDLIVKPL